MSTAVDYSMLNNTASLISEIGGDDPVKEANELFKFAESQEELDEIINRRIKGHEPVAYIVGKCKFGGLTFKTDDRALIPRAETETLLEAGKEAPYMASVVDVGTGCGAVALALKKSRDDLDVTGIDISKDALDLAWVNGERLGATVDWHEGNLLEGYRKDIDVVLANLPYLPKNRETDYLPEMVEHEPEISLWGGDDGYDLIKKLLKQVEARRKIKMVALEIGKGTEEVVMELVRRSTFKTVYGITDSKGDIRAVCGKR